MTGRNEMKIHPDVLAAHAQFGGDLELMQKAYEHPDLVVRLSDAEARIAELQREAVHLKAEISSSDTLIAALEARAEAAEALLKEARPLLVYLSRETTTDHIGDEWLTPTARAARSLASKIGVKDAAS